LSINNLDLIISLAARHRLPAGYQARLLVADGVLISYGADSLGQSRQAAGYVDRILKGEKARRPTSAERDQIRVGDQPQDR